ncbi:MAG: alpha-galactosidase [Ktedonobacterales bacterium]
MDQVQAQCGTGEAGAETLLTNGRVEVHWQEDAQLVLRDPFDKETRVAGGPLVELAPHINDARQRTLGLGLAHDSSDIGEPERMEDAHGSYIALRRRFPIAVQPLTLEWMVRVYDKHPFVRMDLTLQNTGTVPITIRRIFPFVTGSWWGNNALRLGSYKTEFAVYKNGWQSSSYAGGLPLDVADPYPQSKIGLLLHSPAGRAPRQPISGTIDVVSDAMALLGHQGQSEALLAGFLSADRWLGQVYAQRRDGAFAACALLDDATLEPGQTVATPPLLLALGPQERLPVLYAEAVGREQGARRSMSVPTVWCSHHAYPTALSEEAILDNVTSLRALRGMLPVEVVEIDDGYQTAIGDWLIVNEQFPHGMDAVAERLRADGYRPGIWLAPFTISPNSRLAQQHPEWLVHDETGNPVFGGRGWGTDLYGLDTTHPGAQDWLQRVFTLIVEHGGYDYLKLDALSSGALTGLRHDPSATRAGALRDGLRLIRETVGEDTFLLGCGSPLLSAVGLLDAMRIAPDVAPHWEPRNSGSALGQGDFASAPSLHNALRNTLTRSWMHHALWINDPGCLPLGARKSELTEDEMHAFATAVGLTGAMTQFSSRVSQVTLARLDLFQKLLPPMPERALPVSYLTHDMPELVMTQIVRPWGRWLLVGLFNSGREPRDMTVQWSALGLTPDAYHTTEFWSGSYLGLSKSGVDVRVPAHGAAVLAVHAQRDEPQLLSTSFHISQGAVEIAEWSYDHDRAEVSWTAQLGRDALGMFTLWLPESLSPHHLTSTANRAEWRRDPRGEVVITAEIRGSARFTLELNRIT